MAEWTTSPYETAQMHPENLIHKTFSGHVVRSKSEVLIDTALFMNHLPFRYECALNLSYTTIYPDFTIRHPKTGDTYYWEHFGLIDDPKYSKNAFSKIQLYISEGILPGIQLITTYETTEKPLTSNTIDKVIKLYFQ